MGDIKPAKKISGKAIASFPSHVASVWARLDLAAIAEKENDADTRLTLLKQLAFDVERKGPAVQPCVDAVRQYTQILFRKGEFEEGLRAFLTTCDDAHYISHIMHPSLGSLPQAVWELTGSMDDPAKKRGEKLADAGCAWLKTKVGDWLKDEKTKPRAVEAWYAIATVRAHARQPDKQKAVYEEMLTALGADDSIYGALAQWHKDNKQRDQARAIYAKFKDTVAGKAAIAHSFEEEQQWDKAVAIYRELAADAMTAPKWLAAAAMAYRHAKKPDLAIKIYQELLTSDAKNADSYHVAIADTYYGANQWKEAITAYRGTTNFPTNYQHMAHANRQLKQYDEAISLYRQIIAASPNHASWSLLQIAYTQEEAGKKEDAIKTLKMICDKFPKTGEGSTAHARLNQVYKIPVTLGGTKD
ncbi:MAG: tetratricopeptide repeat protein [Gemmataceae bacterium]